MDNYQETMNSVNSVSINSQYTTGTNTGVFDITSITPVSPDTYTISITDTTASPFSIYPHTNPSLQVTGDAEIKGRLKVGDNDIGETLEKICQRLAILHPNEKLEQRWEQLRELREQYKQLEAELLEKEKMWDVLTK
jgi:hypothetical protein